MRRGWEQVQSHRRAESLRRFEKLWLKTKRNEGKEEAFEPRQLKAAYQFVPGNAVGRSQGTWDKVQVDVRRGVSVWN